ncbi:MAG: YfiR family protein [Flavobacteriales bacterium]|nr:YfiR family protein [Flavobacteriales bacterium]
MSRYARVLVLPFLLCAAVPQQRDADKDTTAILQANYLYNIAKLVEWKDPAMRNGNFIIGVIGNANLYQELIKQYSTRTIGKQPIEVRKLPRTADVERCHLLFVGRTELSLYRSSTAIWPRPQPCWSRSMMVRSRMAPSSTSCE